MAVPRRSSSTPAVRPPRPCRGPGADPCGGPRDARSGTCSRRDCSLSAGATAPRATGISVRPGRGFGAAARSRHRRRRRGGRSICFLTGAGSVGRGFGAPNKPRALLNNVAATAGFLAVWHAKASHPPATRRRDRRRTNTHLPGLAYGSRNFRPDRAETAESPSSLEARRRARPTPAELPFQSIYRHGFVRVAVATPRVEVADPKPMSPRRSGWPGRRRPSRSRSPSFPSWGSPPTPTKTCSTRTPCWMPRWGRSSAWSRQASNSRSPALSAYRCAWTAGCSTAGLSSPRRVARRRAQDATCRTTASSTKSGISLRAAGPVDLDHPAWPDRAVRVEAAVRGHQRARLRAQPGGLRRRLGAAAAEHHRSAGRARPSSRTCPPATSPSARPITGACSAPRSRRNALLPTCIPRLDPANRRRTLPGTATH